MTTRVSFLLMVLLSFGASRLNSQSALTETRSTLEQWVETRQLISRQKADWEVNKEMLQQSIDLFERELKLVEEQMSKLSTNNVEVDKERTQTEAVQKSSIEGLDAARKFSTDFEGELTKLNARLPLPLQELIKPLLAKIPADPATTKMAVSERVQVVVGVLNELDKFNNAVTIFSERRKNAKGDEVSVEMVYVGLGAAYFVNESGDFAGMGTPNATEWEWTIKPELAPAVREIIRIYRNERPARFVALPAVIR